MPGGGSKPYPNPHRIKTCAEFFRGRFLNDMVRDNSLTDGVCLRTPDHARFLFYKEDAEAVRVDLSKMAGPQRAVAVDALRPYQEMDLGLMEARDQTWKPPHKSDWAIAVGRFERRQAVKRSP